MRLFLALALLVTALPSAAAPDTERRFTVSAGYAGSTVDVDTDRDGNESLTLSGWGLRGRVNLDDRWALQARWSEVEDEWPGGEMTLERIDLLALRQWISPSSRHRLYFSFGATRLSVEERVSVLGVLKDDATSPAVGLGWEWGQNRWAFSVDFVGTVVDVETGFGEESWIAGATITGFSYRF